MAASCCGWPPYSLMYTSLMVCGMNMSGREEPGKIESLRLQSTIDENTFRTRCVVRPVWGEWELGDEG